MEIGFCNQGVNEVCAICKSEYENYSPSTIKFKNLKFQKISTSVVYLQFLGVFLNTSKIKVDVKEVKH